MVKLSQEQKGEAAFKYHTEIVANETERRKLLSRNAELLTDMIGLGLYKIFLGDETAQPAAYLSQLEVFYSRLQLNRLRAIQRHFKERLGIDPVTIFDIPESRLSDLLVVTTPENVEELLGLARTMLPRDWAAHIRGLKNLPTPESCPGHKYVEYEICAICGEKHQK